MHFVQCLVPPQRQVADRDHDIQTKGEAGKRQRIGGGTAIAAVRYAYGPIQPDNGSICQRGVATQACSALQAGNHFRTKKAFRHVLVSFGFPHLLTSWLTLQNSLPFHSLPHPAVRNFCTDVKNETYPSKGM